MRLSKNSFLLAVLTVLFPSVFSCTPDQYECKSNQGRWSCPLKTKLCDGNPDCHWKDDEQKCDVIPKVRVSCDQVDKNGYYKAKKVTCTCRPSTYDYDVHKGSAQWLKDEVAADEPLTSVTWMSDTPEANKGYRCSGQSGFDQRDEGTPEDPKFAYFDRTEVMLSPTELTVCSPDNSPQVVCKVLKTSVNPAPEFSFHGDGAVLVASLPALETDTHYQQVLDVPRPAEGGSVDIACHVTNAVFTDLKQVAEQSVKIIQSPAQPPVVKILGQIFQGVSSINIATVPHNFTGSLTCEVSGGFPPPRIGSLACGDNTGYSGSNGTTGTVRFQNVEVTRAMHSVYCSCVAEHSSGCYGNRETTVKVKVLFPGSQEGSQSVAPIVIAVILAIIVVLLIIAIVLLVLRQRKQSGEAGTKSERVELSEEKA